MKTGRRLTTPLAQVDHLSLCQHYQETCLYAAPSCSSIHPSPTLGDPRPLGGGGRRQLRLLLMLGGCGQTSPARAWARKGSWFEKMRWDEELALAGGASPLGLSRAIGRGAPHESSILRSSAEPSTRGSSTPLRKLTGS